MNYAADATHNTGDYVAGCLLVRGDEVFVVRTNAYPDKWQPVAGRAEEGDESPLHTALREVAEEANLHLDAKRLIPFVSVQRDKGDGVVHFFLVELHSEEAICLDYSELRAGAWVHANELPELPAFDASRACFDAFVSRGRVH